MLATEYLIVADWAEGDVNRDKKTRLIYFKYSGAMVASKIRLTLTDQEQS